MTETQQKYCEQCGARLSDGVRFCEQCGAQVPSASVTAPQSSTSTPATEDVPDVTPSPSTPKAAASVSPALAWETGVSILGNPLIRKQMVLVVLISGGFMALLLSFIVAVSGDADQIPLMLRISLFATAGLGALMALVSLVFFGNRVRVRFTLDDDGALWETVDKRALTGNRLALLGAALARSPQAGGAAAVATAREREYVSWSDAVEARVDRRHRMVTLRNSWRPIMLLVCTPENFEEVVAIATCRIVPQPAAIAPDESTPRSHPLRSGLLRTLVVVLASAPLLMLPSFLNSMDMLLPLILFMFALATVWLIPLFGWVVIACAGILAVQIALIGVEEFAYLWTEEQVVFILAYVGLAILARLGWRAVRGRVVPALMQG